MIEELTAAHAAETLRRVHSIRRGVERAVAASPLTTYVQREEFAERARPGLLVLSTQASRAESIHAQRYAAEAQVPPPASDPPDVPSPDTVTELAKFGAVLGHAYVAARRRSADPGVIRRIVGVVTGSAASKAVMGDARRWNYVRFTRDPNIVAYRRVPDADPCYFCALLASRGFVYRSRTSAGDTEVIQGWHDACACTSQPLYRGQVVPELDPVTELAENLYRSSTAGEHGVGKRRAFRAAWEARSQPS
jgi:hypothetical protein